MKRFEGKVALVTGASRGIGAEIARCFAKEGASLCITDKDAENLKKVASECTENGSPKVVEVIADLSKTDSYQKIINEAIESLQRIDILVNNAGIFKMDGGVSNVSLEDYDKLFNINLKAAFFLTQLAAPHLKKVKGTVVNMSSLGSTLIHPGTLVYCMTKAGMDYFTKCTALELAESGVRVNAVNPGVVKTKIYADQLNQEQQNQLFEGITKQTPLGQLATTDEVAKAVLFLASEEASMITGTCLRVDGGMGLQSG